LIIIVLMLGPDLCLLLFLSEHIYLYLLFAVAYEATLVVTTTTAKR